MVLLILFSWSFTSSHRYLMPISSLRFRINLMCSVKYEECRSKFSAECRKILSKESVRLQVMQLLVFCFEIYLVSLGCKLYIAIFVLVSI